MHVLLLALNYHPDKLGNAPLMTGLAEGLVERGHRVTVVCAMPHHETGRIEAAYRGKGWVRDRRNGVEIVRVWLWARGGGAAAKMAGYLSFSGSALGAALGAVRGVDVVLTPSPPLTLGLADIALGRLWGVPYVYNVQDLFPEAAVRLGVLRNRGVIAGFERLERWVLRRAARVVVISEGFLPHVRAAGVAAGRAVYVPNFAEVDEIVPQPRAGNAFRARLGWGDDCFVVQFSGRMGYSQGLDGVVEAWRRLRARRPDARLMMVGDGQAQAGVAAALAGDDRAAVLPTQPREDLAALLGAADVGLAPLLPGMAATCIPSKIFGIMAAGRPVVAGVEGESETARLVVGSGGGVVVPPADPRALAGAIEGLMDDRAAAAAMGAAGRRYVVAHHARAAVVARYEAVLRAVVDEAAACAG